MRATEGELHLRNLKQRVETVDSYFFFFFFLVIYKVGNYQNMRFRIAVALIGLETYFLDFSYGMLLLNHGCRSRFPGCSELFSLNKFMPK